MEYVTLNNGVKMPILGCGVYHVTKEECGRCVLDAMETGYRQSYCNDVICCEVQMSDFSKDLYFSGNLHLLKHNICG